jgi:hypothetical protein
VGRRAPSCLQRSERETVVASLSNTISISAPHREAPGLVADFADLVRTLKVQKFLYQQAA